MSDSNTDDHLISHHPEVLTFNQDRFILSPAVKKYISDFKQNYPELNKNLSAFRTKFSSINKVDIDSMESLFKLSPWTHDSMQADFAQDSFNRILDQYPVSSTLKNIKVGEYLDLREIKDNDQFLRKIDNFLELVKSLPKPEKIDIDTKKLGHILLQNIDDPLLVNSVNKVWTMDVTFNPGLSIKDAMALYMIEDGIKKGEINENTILVEGTSGNTGAGMAIIGAKYGLKRILIIPDKMSQEKIDRLRSLGADVIVTPTKVDATDIKSYYSVRDYIKQKAGAWRANQYDNLANRKAHEEVTGPEIWEQTGGQVTVVIATAGTCGTISGVAKFLKEKNKDIKIIAIDTVGSILYLLKEGYSIDLVTKYAKEYKIQGFGEDIQPKNLDISLIDKFIRVSDISGLNMTQFLPALGFISGQSSGAAYTGMLEAINQNLISSKDNVVVIFPDTGIPYRKDVYNDQWIMENNFYLN